MNVALPPKRHRSIPTAFIALACVAALGLSACSKGSAAGKPTPAAAVAAPKTTAVKDVEVPVTLALDGTLLADEDSHITSVVPGRVMAVLVERGQVVKKGEPLVRLRDVDYRLQAEAAQAALDQARARLGITAGEALPKAEGVADVRAAAADKDLAEKNLARAEELAQKGVLSAQQIEESRARTTAAQERYNAALNGARAAVAQVSSAQVAFEQARVATSEAIVRAPFDGEVADRMISVGEFVAPQSPLVTLVRTDPLRLELQVPQQHMSRVHTGQVVLVTLDAFPGKTFEGSIRYMSASVNRATRGLVVEAVVPNAERTLRPGMFARVRIETGVNERLPLVPASAVLTEAGVNRVFVIKNHTVEERVVSVKDRRGDQVVLEGGVNPGEVLAVEKLDQLGDGIQLKP